VVKIELYIKKLVNKTSSKEYMKNKGRYVQVKNFVKAMIAACKLKTPKKLLQQKSPKSCIANQHRNPATCRCVKNKVPKSPKKKAPS